MLNNCSACKSNHMALFGQFCKYKSLKYCDKCASSHEGLVGTACEVYYRTGLYMCIVYNAGGGDIWFSGLNRLMSDHVVCIIISIKSNQINLKN